MSNKLDEFLLAHKVSNDAEFTHTSLIGGKYNIPLTKMDNFHKIYHEQVFLKKKNYCLSERHPDGYSKICIDFDFRKNDENNEIRLYDLNFIKDVVTCYQDTIREILPEEPDSRELLAYVFEKEKSEYDEEKIVKKDGIHIMFPAMCVSYKAQHWIRKNVIKKMSENPIIKNCDNAIENIIDESVVERNNWIMLGSKKKPTGQAYKLTYIFDTELEEIEIQEPGVQLLKLLSIQHRFNEKETMIEKLIQNEQTVQQSIRQAEAIQVQVPVEGKKSKPYLKALLSLLKPIRVEDYHDWLRVGAILFNEGEDNLDLFKDWSSQSSKYSESHCDKLWTKTYPGHPVNRRARLASLQMMAREDSPQRYFAEMEKFRGEDDLIDVINKAMKNTDYEFAQLVHFVLKDKYRYSNGRWYIFNGSKWKIMDEEALPLKNDIIVKVGGILFSYSSTITLQIAMMQAQSGSPLGESDPLVVKRAILEETLSKLKSYQRKNTMVNESKLMFRDENFFKELDMNIYLLGFDNGVYDLKEGIFRPVEPDDKISYTTGYNYTGDVIPEIRDVIVRLFEQSLPNPNVRRFMLTFLASSCIGRNKNELFVNLEGTGGNGKGVITTLHDYALGDYSGTLDSAYLTNIANSQEGHNSKLISIFAKRYVQVNEPPKGKSLNLDFIKGITGNDKFQIRKAHAPDPEEDKVPMFKLVMLCNKMPRIEDPTDGGFRRRYLGVNFPNRFVDREPTRENEFRADPNIKTKLKDDIRYRQQWMLLMLEYVKEYIAKKEMIDIPTEVEQNSRMILREQDNYSEFVEECMEVTGNENDYVTCKEMSKIYVEYFKNFISGGARPKTTTLTEFTEIMKTTFLPYSQVEFKKDIRTEAGKKEKGFVGVRQID